MKSKSKIAPFLSHWPGLLNYILKVAYDVAVFKPSEKIVIELHGMLVFEERHLGFISNYWNFTSHRKLTLFQKLHIREKVM